MKSSKKLDQYRSHLRAQVAYERIQGVLTTSGLSKAQGPFLVWDVSERGLGLWTTELLEPGDKVRITVGQPYLLILEAQVMWCDTQKTHEGFRCGLEVREQNTQLAALYKTFSKAFLSEEEA